MDEKPNYYAIIPAEVRYDKTLRAGAKIFYGEITALCSKYGVCTASNNYFAKLYKMTPSGITHWITQLKDKGYINVEYETEGNEIKQRRIIINQFNASNKVIDRVMTNVNRVVTKVGEGYLQKVKENNTSNNITSNNNIPPIIPQEKSTRFVKPTVEEISQYCEERVNGIDAEEFYDFYESKGWMVGKNKMKDWKACIRTWEKARKKERPKTRQELIDEEIEKWIKEGDEKNDKK